MRNRLCWTIFGCWIFVTGLWTLGVQGQGVEVSATIAMHLQKPGDEGRKGLASAANVVIWLSPLQPNFVRPATAVRQTSYRLVQKDKMFTPHLLVVPTGSHVEFPNQDPFFHNVFSLFNGKRFDLGLYESGTSRSVRFDREGASYIFCNIHPEMGAVVLALSTPYYGISGEDGKVHVRNVPPGSYQLNVWSENGQTAGSEAEKSIQVSAEAIHLGTITLLTRMDPLVDHKNKFGENYPLNRSLQY